MRRILLALVLAFPLMAAKAPAAECWFDSGYLYAINLPIGVAFSITQDAYPTGVHLVTDDGTWSGQTWVTTAIFWVRKGGGGLFKPGPQLNDYKPIAMCSA